MQNNSILITGATGLVGSQLIQTLLKNGHENLKVLSRDKVKAREKFPECVEVFHWDPDAQFIEPSAFTNVGTIFHLAGENIANKKWSSKQKEKLVQSRVLSTKLIVQSIKDYTSWPVKLVSASAIGFYGDRDHEEIDESSKAGTGFLSELCQQWEQSCLDHSIKHLRSYCIRIGIVLAGNGGALEKMLPPFKAGVGGPLGNGKQYMSWIHIEDLVEQFLFFLDNTPDERIFNGVSPAPVTNKDFSSTLGKCLKRPAFMPLPAFILKLILGELSDVLLHGQKVNPNNFRKYKFHYKFSTLENALFNLIHQNKDKNLVYFQWVKKDLHNVFDFFSSEKNLEKITPPHLNFKVLNMSTPRIQNDSVINYQLKLYGFPIYWSSKISNYTNNKVFIDEQLKGPYKKWVHTHSFIPYEGGTLIVDEIKYQLPMGFLGNLFAGSFVKKDLSKIFGFRQKTIQRIFGT